MGLGLKCSLETSQQMRLYSLVPVVDWQVSIGLETRFIQIQQLCYLKHEYTNIENGKDIPCLDILFSVFSQASLGLKLRRLSLELSQPD